MVDEKKDDTSITPGNVELEGRADGYEYAELHEGRAFPPLTKDVLEDRALEYTYVGMNEGWLPREFCHIYQDAFIAGYQQYVKEVQEIEAYGGFEKLQDNAWKRGYKDALSHHKLNTPFMPADRLEWHAMDWYRITFKQSNNTLMRMLYTSEFVSSYHQYMAEVQKKEEK